MKLNRKTVLLLALAGMVGLAIFAPPPDEPVTSPKAASAGRNASAVNEANSSAPNRVAAPSDSAKAGAKGRDNNQVLSEYPERGILGKPQADLFGTQSWLAPPPKVVPEPPAPPPVPQPPAMTYRFVGRFIQDGKFQAFVSKGDLPVVAKVGDNLDGYVIESISASAISLVYPPLGHKLSIAIPPDFVVDNTPPSVAFSAPQGQVPAQVPFPLPGMQPQSYPAPVPKPAAMPARAK